MPPIKDKDDVINFKVFYSLVTKHKKSQGVIIKKPDKKKEKKNTLTSILDFQSKSVETWCRGNKPLTNISSSPTSTFLQKRKILLISTFKKVSW